ncbi:helix-turn-helix domain-containing protein [Niabella hibiscisoli]|uniref:helix-turn-helix domain-containing protein n=1 Tax=Niabella hibiscisoli TaxID=1825928 RepID=UPI001F0D9CAE|nr:helix-turn-helix domain-containing protein [Niabella hibiscisoli]MCH5718593.1 helix-turn-helix domain-containing protein [Niabella hibiscisoli]
MELEKTTQQAQQDSNAKNIPLAAGGLALLFGSGYFYVYRRKQKQQQRLFMAYFEEKKYPAPQQQAFLPEPVLPDTATKNDNIPEVIPADIEQIDEQPDEAQGPKKRDISSIPGEETLQRLLHSLKDFEQQQQFTSGTITLSQLAAQFNTNIKYLSYIIKTYKEQDFNSYINRLRVDYIINQLTEQPQWRTYKISVLAEKAGFSSHGKFTTIFKGVTGLSPSVFIQHLQNEPGN